MVNLSSIKVRSKVYISHFSLNNTMLDLLWLTPNYEFTYDNYF